MSFYGNIVNYLGNFLKSVELSDQNAEGQVGTFLHFQFETSQQNQQDIYVNVKSLNEFEATTDSDTITMDIINEELTAYLKNNSITTEHLSPEVVEQLNNISVVNGVLIID